jgi:hypothetical protein
MTTVRTCWRVTNGDLVQPIFESGAGNHDMHDLRTQLINPRTVVDGDAKLSRARPRFLTYKQAVEASTMSAWASSIRIFVKKLRVRVRDRDADDTALGHPCS